MANDEIPLPLGMCIIFALKFDVLLGTVCSGYIEPICYSLGMKTTTFTVWFRMQAYLAISKVS